MPTRSKTIKALVKVLEQTKQGQRLWFWFSTDVDEGESKLLHARVFCGLVSVDENGTLHFGAPGLRNKHLVALSNWTKEIVDEVPAVARLKNSSFSDVSTKGIVEERYQDLELWKNVPDITVAGTLDETIERLNMTKANRPYWFWLTNNGPGNAPYLCLSSVKKDPKGLRFAGKIQETKRSCSSQMWCISGIIRRAESNRLLLVTNDDIQEGRNFFKRLETHSPQLLSVMADAWILEMSGEKISRIIRKDKDSDLHELCKTLSGTSEEKKYFFCFMKNNFLVLEDRKELKRSIAKLPENEFQIKGTIQKSKKGWLHFQTQIDQPEFLIQLIEWTCKQRLDWPELKCLQFARLSCQSKNGKVLGRYKEDQLWKEAFGER